MKRYETENALSADVRDIFMLPHLDYIFPFIPQCRRQGDIKVTTFRLDICLDTLVQTSGTH